MEITNPKRIVMLDGAMGTMIQKYGLEEDDFRRGYFEGHPRDLKGNNECLNLTRPDVIAEIHKEYIDAGADIIETNTFSANSISQKEYGLADMAAKMAYCGARIAREAADAEAAKPGGRKVLVAGSMGPTSKSLTLAPDISNPARRDITFDEMAEAYYGQAKALIDGGADLLIIETCFDALNTKAALYAVSRIEWGFPVIVSVTASDKSGRTLTGQTMEAFYNSVRHYPLTAFGINCALGAHDMIPIVKEIASFCEVPVICYPNAGLPDELGNYNERPEHMAYLMGKMGRHLNIAGGCCGTLPDHICAVSTALTDIPPREVPGRDGHLRVSGLEAYTIDTEKNRFTNIGERTNVAGSRKFAKLIAAGDYDAAVGVAATQIENGANIIDINMDDAMLDSPMEMEAFVRYIENDPSVAKAALMIDSSHWESILAGLKNAQGKCIVNSISLKEGEEAFLDKALEIRNLGAAMVVMAFDEKGQATTFGRKVEICRRAYDILTSNGISPEDIIFDVNVLSIGTGIEEHARYAVDFIEAVRWIKANLPGCYTSGGISNLSFAFRGNNPVREAMHSAFLYHAVAAGLDMGIVNPAMLQVYDDIEPELRTCVEDVIFDRDPQATERLIAKAQKIMEQQSSDKAAETGAAAQDAGSAVDRITEALVKGKSATLREDVLECLEKEGAAVKVIEGPLMSGMERVGVLFGEGKMFLPQVVKSAKVMKDAVAILEPYMKGDGESSGGRPLVIMATVKGDVHDIGKNITGIVLGCNGFEVKDLGVMVDKAEILDAAVAGKAAIIGVSGLITPSLFQMEELCREMTARHLDIPLLIGGATTSALHTAVKLAPLYDHVFYGQDASDTAVKAKRIMLDREAFEKSEHEAQERLREMRQGRAAAPAAGSDEGGFSRRSYLTKAEFEPWEAAALEIPIKDLQSMFDWDTFLMACGIRAPRTCTQGNREIAGLRAEGRRCLRALVRGAQVRVRYSLKFFQAYSKDDTLVLEGGAGKGAALPMLRQEEPARRADGKVCRMSLCDWAPPAEYDTRTPVGLFAISVHTGDCPLVASTGGRTGKLAALGSAGPCRCPGCESTYDNLIERAVRVTLAETASKWIDRELKKALKNTSKVISKPAVGYAACPDHSLKKDIFGLLPKGAEGLGIELTDSCAMIPDASICGLVFIHPVAAFPEIRKISSKQYASYAMRRGFTEEQARQYLGYLL